MEKTNLKHPFKIVSFVLTYTPAIIQAALLSDSLRQAELITAYLIDHDRQQGNEIAFGERISFVATRPRCWCGGRHQASTFYFCW